VLESTDKNGAAVLDETFLAGPVKVGTVVDGGLVGRGASKDGWFPRVEVRVKVDDGDRTVGGVDGPENGKDDRMVTAKCDDSWVVFAVGGNGNERFARQRVISERGKRRPMQELLVAVLDLLDSKFVVVGRDGDVAAIDELEVRMERVDFERDVVASI